MNQREILNLRRQMYREQSLLLDDAEVCAETDGTAHSHTAHVIDIEQSEKYRQLLSQAMRIKAEFENFRKRTQRELDNTKKFANEDLLIKLVPVLDDFDRALQAAETSDNIESVVSGVRIIREHFWNQLRSAGVEQIETDGQLFDPNVHEAVQMVEAEGVDSNHVAQTLQTGYKLNERVIRAAMVAVAK